MKIYKKNPQGETTWEYEGEELERGENFITLEARFNRDDLPFQGVVLKRGDRFVETFYTDKWFNIFEIHDREDDTLKGWYCNIAKPAAISAQEVSYVDLALDLWVSVSGRQVVLDEDEFAALSLDEKTKRSAYAALREIQQKFAPRLHDVI